MRHKEVDVCASCLEHLLFSIIVVSIVMCHTASAGETNLGRGDAIEELERTRDKAATEAERGYYSFCIQYEQLLRGKDAKRLADLRSNLLDFGRKTPDDPFRARALILAGDLSQVALKEYAQARAYYSEGEAVFVQNPDWPISQEYLPYTGIRAGDSLAHELRFEEAVSTWEKTFLSYPQYSFSQSIPGKVAHTYGLFLSPQEAATKTLSFYDKALEAVWQSDRRPRLEVERMVFAFRGRHFAPPFFDLKLVSDIDDLLNRYKPGENKFLDRARQGFLQMKDLLRKEDDSGLLGDVNNALLDTALLDSVEERAFPKGDPRVTVAEPARKEVPGEQRSPKEELQRDKTERTKHRSSYLSFLLGAGVVSAVGFGVVKMLKSRRCQRHW